MQNVIPIYLFCLYLGVTVSIYKLTYWARNIFNLNFNPFGFLYYQMICKNTSPMTILFEEDCFTFVRLKILKNPRFIVYASWILEFLTTWFAIRRGREEQALQLNIPIPIKQ